MDDNRVEMRRYLRLATLLREEIASGLLAPGSSLPSIGYLCQVHGISRQTAGKALRRLENEGLVYRVPGLGYFVMALHSNDMTLENCALRLHTMRALHMVPDQVETLETSPDGTPRP
jgi:DNA-binding GntR family transcriptional regulator